MKLLDGLRLFLCSLCFALMTYLAPASNPEGIRILKIIRDWSAKEILLKNEKTSQN